MSKDTPANGVPVPFVWSAVGPAAVAETADPVMVAPPVLVRSPMSYADPVTALLPVKDIPPCPASTAYGNAFTLPCVTTACTTRPKPYAFPVPIIVVVAVPASVATVVEAVTPPIESVFVDPTGSAFFRR